MEKTKKSKGKSERDLVITPTTIENEMTIAEVVSHHPETMPVFMKYGMRCFGCPMALQETVAQGAEAHGTNPAKLVEELNKAIKSKKKK